MKGRLNYRDYMKSLMNKKEYACFSWKDPLPGFMYIALSPYLLLSR
jgi:predicted ATP-grasp superfamily ATP-dependent carboligase